MKSKKYFLFSVWMLMIVWSCGTDSQQNANADNNKTKNSEVLSQDDNWQQVLTEKTPLDKDGLYKLFPQKLGERPLIGINDNPGTNGAIGTYSNEGETSHLTRHISLIIIDGAGYSGFQHINAVHRMLESNYSEENDKGWSRIEERNNLKMISQEQTSGDRLTSGVSFIKNQRYHITLNGSRLPIDELYGPANEIRDLKFPE